jgi:DNA segregation ATPase FtsK/SpoIIIE-like protein
MLFVPPGTGHLRRVHGAFVSEDEIHKVVEFIRTGLIETATVVSTGR